MMTKMAAHAKLDPYGEDLVATGWMTLCSFHLTR